MFSAATKTDNVSSAANYIEDVFSTYLYTGTGGTQSIPSGIDYTKGFLYWAKTRDSGASGNNHYLVDSERGANSILISNTTGAASAPGNQWTALTTTSITVQDFLNLNGRSEVGWTFRKQAKFFDVVTFTASAAAAYTFNHNLGSTPGFVIIKPTSVAGSWYCYHTSLGVNKYLLLDSTAASATNPSGNWAATSTTFTVPTDFLSGGTQTYVAYLFANNAGGFGATGADNVISCGSFTSATSTINLGYEPQFILFKASNGTGNWRLVDNMRGLPASGNPQELYPNLSQAETSNGGVNITSTGFTQQMNDFTYIYIAIRRGPMKTPTSGTSVFTPVTYTGDAAASKTISTGKTYVTDWLMTWDRTNGTFGTGTGYNSPVITRLTGFGVDPPYLRTNATSAEAASVVKITLNNAQFDYTVSGTSGNLNGSAINYINWNFGRAPGFFDVVCYTGNSTANRQVSHNLGVAPELIIVKKRNGVDLWPVYNPLTVATNNVLYLEQASSLQSNAAVLFGNGTSVVAPTATNFTLGAFTYVNDSANTYVAYLFASCPGVSKVGSYTGTGALQTINCGFAAGARFVLIKRTDSTGDWWVYDSARGISSGNDPYLFLNSTAPEVTGTNYVDTTSVGFQVTAAAPAGLNANGGTYLFLAIA